MGQQLCFGFSLFGSISPVNAVGRVGKEPRPLPAWQGNAPQSQHRLSWPRDKMQQVFTSIFFLVCGSCFQGALIDILNPPCSSEQGQRGPVAERRLAMAIPMSPGAPATPAQRNPMLASARQQHFQSNWIWPFGYLHK